MWGLVWGLALDLVLDLVLAQEMGLGLVLEWGLETGQVLVLV